MSQSLELLKAKTLGALEFQAEFLQEDCRDIEKLVSEAHELGLEVPVSSYDTDRLRSGSA